MTPGSGPRTRVCCGPCSGGGLGVEMPSVWTVFKVCGVPAFLLPWWRDKKQNNVL